MRIKVILLAVVASVAIANRAVARVTDDGGAEMVKTGGAIQLQNVVPRRFPVDNSVLIDEIITEAVVSNSIPDSVNGMIDALPSGGSDRSELQQLFSEMSGDFHASAKSALVSSDLNIQSAALAQARAAFAAPETRADGQSIRFGLGITGKRNLAGSSGGSALWVSPVTFWGKHKAGKGSGYKGLRYRGSSFLVGGDTALHNNLRLGFFTGFGNLEFSQLGSDTEASDKGAHGGFYGGGRLGPLLLNGGFSYSQHTIESVRMIGGVDTGGAYRARTYGVFSEIGYRLASYSDIVFEQFFGADYSYHKSAAFREFVVEDGSETFIMREHSSKFGNLKAGMRVFMSGESLSFLPANSSLNWKVLFNFLLKKPDIIIPQSIGTSSVVEIRGTPLSKSSFLIEGNLNIAMSQGMAFGLTYGYSGLGSNENTKHSLVGKLTYDF